MSDERRALWPFAVISVAYLLFTITDGAIRMIVLLHAYNQGFSALQVSIMFTLYELAGVVTNLVAGFAGAKMGIKCTLVTGLSLQLVSYGMLFGWSAIIGDDGDGGGSDSRSWCVSSATQIRVIAYVTVAQMFGGIAKDLTKLGGKTVTKLVTPDEKTTRLFRLVSMLTGWKNSLKGVGYFLGSALVAVRYEAALAAMMGFIVLALPVAAFGLDRKLGTAAKKNAKFSDVFITHNPNLNWLSLARCFLFASRDFWFEVPLPFFARSPSCAGLGSTVCGSDADCGRGAVCALSVPSASTDELGCDSPTGALFGPSGAVHANVSGLCINPNVGGGCGGLGWNRVVVGTLLAGYIIVYGQVCARRGVCVRAVPHMAVRARIDRLVHLPSPLMLSQVQSWTPQLVTKPLRQDPPNKLTEVLWGGINCVPTAVMAAIALAYSMGYDGAGEELALSVWMMVGIVAFAFIFAINSSSAHLSADHTCSSPPPPPNKHQTAPASLRPSSPSHHLSHSPSTARPFPP